MIDVHSHILPCLDDGSASVEESLELLRLMKKQGIEKVFATPHFYPEVDNSEDFFKAVFDSLNTLNDNIKFNSLPEIYLGCEMFYYHGIGDCDSLKDFCFEGSSYLLLELPSNCIDKNLLQDLQKIIHNKKITPIIAHIERYFDSKHFKKLLKLIKQENIPVQINASSVLHENIYNDIKKIIKKDLVTFVATDSHSVNERPPQMQQALDILEKDFGKDYTEKLIENSKKLFDKIISETDFYVKNL